VSSRSEASGFQRITLNLLSGCQAEGRVELDGTVVRRATQNTRASAAPRTFERGPDAKGFGAETDLKVQGVGPFTNFDPHDEYHLPSVPGIYVFYDISDRAVYVGKAQDIAARIKDRHTGHWDKFWYRHQSCSRERSLGLMMRCCGTKSKQ
jgi:hypothetical protein